MLLRWKGQDTKARKEEKALWKKQIAAPCRPGDRVAIVAPSSPFAMEDLLAGCALLRSWSLEPVYDPAILSRWGYLAGADDLRRRVFLEAWRDPSIKAVLCARGGYGSMRLLSQLSLAELAHTPKRLLGFSDVTLLLNTFVQTLGQIAFHSPMVASKLFLGGTPESQESVRRALFGEELESIFLPIQGRWLQGQSVTAPILGGNLTMIASAVGTPWALDSQGVILLLEEVGESPYRVDRLMQQLRYSGLLGRVKGIALGDMGAYRDQYQAYTTEEMWRERFDLPEEISLLCDLPVGHIHDNRAVPLGAWMTLDAKTQSLRLASQEEVAASQTA